MNRRWSLIIAIATVLLYAAGDVAVRAADESAVKLYGEVDTTLSACRAAGIELSSKKLPAKIDAVRLGSSAVFAGLRAGDTVTSSEIGEKSLKLQIARQGKIFAVNLPIVPTKLVGEAPVTASEQRAGVKAGGQKFDMDGDISDLPPERKLKILNGYEVAVVVDRSASMSAPLRYPAMSKWQWCASDVGDLAARLRDAGRRDGITLAEFNQSYEIQRNCGPDQVAAVFQKFQPSGNTDLGSPIQRILDDYLATGRGHPLLVVVLTDGIPNAGPDIREVITDATKRMRRPDEVRIEFLEIGDEYDGRALLNYLDDDLLYAGAKYDIVDSLTFDQVKSLGLVDCMLHALVDQAKPSPGTEKLAQDLARVQAEIERAQKVKSNGGMKNP